MEGYNGSGVTADSLLWARGANIGGYGYGNGYGYGGDFANASANAIRLDRNAQQVENQADCTREVLSKSMDNNARAFDMATNSDAFTRVCDKITNSEFRTADRLRDIEREMNANARTAADCCCDLKVQAANDKAEILCAVAKAESATLAAEARGVERTLNSTQAELISLKTQVACGCSCGHGHGHGH